MPRIKRSPCLRDTYAHRIAHVAVHMHVAGSVGSALIREVASAQVAFIMKSHCMYQC